MLKPVHQVALLRTLEMSRFLALAIWAVGIQVFSLVLIPVWTALLLRYGFLITYYRPLP